jgi:adenylyltransferase/sulfurtransferase
MFLKFKPSIPEIEPVELKQRLDQEQPLTLVDVREYSEANIADLPDVGQKRIPVKEFITRIEELDPEANIVVYCRSGARSGWAVERLLEVGFDKVWNLKGGVLGWRQQVDPTIQAY